MMSRRITKLLVTVIISTSILISTGNIISATTTKTTKNNEQTNKVQTNNEQTNKTQTNNQQTNNEQINNTQTNNQQNINQKNGYNGNYLFKNEKFTFLTGEPNIEYTAIYAVDSSESYVPSVNPNSKINVVTNGTHLVVTIPFNFNNISTSNENIEKVWISMTPSLAYLNNSINPENMENQPIPVSGNEVTGILGSETNLNSTSSGTLLSTFSFSNLDWKENLNLNLKVNFLYQGKTYSFPVELPIFKTANKYEITNTAIVQVSNNQNSKGLNVQFRLNNANNTSGFYNPLNHKVKSITFNIQEGSNIELIPIKNEYIQKNSDGSYTISGPLVNMTNNQTSLNKLFDIKLKEGTYTEQVIVTPISISYQNLENPTYISNENNVSGSCNISNTTYGEKYNMGQFSVDDTDGASGLNGIITKFGSNIAAGIAGQYDIYSGSLIYRGQVFFVGGVDNYMNRINTNSKNEYVYLNSDQVNIMKNGTPKQKAQLMQKIVQGRVNKIYSNQEIIEMNNNKQALPNVNFIFVRDNYTGKALNMNQEYTKVQTTHNYDVTSNTFTLGIAKEGTTINQIETIAGGLNKTYDTLVMNDNGESIGFFLGSANDKTPINRFSQADIGYSNTQPYVDALTGVTIDNTMQIYQAVYTRDIDWAHREHKFKFSYTSIGTTRTEQLKAGSRINIYMGAPFTLNSGITINGQILASENYKIEGNNIIITTPELIQHNYLNNFYTIYNIELDATYNVFTNQKIVAWSKLGTTGLEGLEYNFNNQIENYYDHGPSWCSNQGVVIDIVDTSKNYCLQTGTNVDSNNNSTITAMVYNPSLTTNQYLIIGGIPGNNTNISNTLGVQNYGNLKAVLTGFNSDGYDTWVLPKSALNKKNQEILVSVNNSDLSSIYSYIQNPKSGWIKYTKGMDLSKIVGYIVSVQIGGQNSISLSYNLHLSNVQKGVYQLSNTAFKYYNMDSNVGSNSNIFILTPPNSPTENSYVTSVQNTQGIGVNIPYLIGHGEDNDGENKTPIALINKIKWANGQNVSDMNKTLKSYGYKLSQIKVNGKVENLEWFENVGISNNSGITNITFVVEHEVPFTIKVNSTNPDDKKAEVSTVLVTSDNYPNFNIDALASAIETANKRGEVVTQILWNGVNYTKNINVFIEKLKQLEESEITDQSQGENIEVSFKKLATISQMMETDNGSILIPQTIVANGLEGQNKTIKPLEIPKGYYLVSVNIDGKEISKNVNGKVTYTLPTKILSENQEIKYIVASYVTTKVNVVDKTGKVLLTFTQTGKENATLNNKVNIPNGYKLINVMVNDVKTAINEVPKTLGTANQMIIYNVEKLPTTTNIEVIDTKGNVLDLVSEAGASGEKLEKNITIPTGYKIVKITLNGKVINQNQVPNTYANKAQKIIYIVRMLPTNINIKVVSANEVLSNLEYSGEPTTKTKIKDIIIPLEYEVQSVTVNGQIEKNSDGTPDINVIPKVFGKENIEIVYNLSKKPIYSISNEMVTNQGTILTNKIEIASGYVGKKENLKPLQIPKGYYLNLVSINGRKISKEINGKVEFALPTEIIAGNQNIKYEVIPYVRTDIKVVDKSGKVLLVFNQVGKQNEILNNKVSIPKGYKVVDIKLDNKLISTNEIPKTLGVANQTIIYNVEKIVNEKYNVQAHIRVVTNDNIVIYSSNLIGVPNEKLSENVVISKGFKLVKITVNNKIVKIPPIEFGNKDETIIYYVEKIDDPNNEVKNKDNGTDVKKDSETENKKDNGTDSKKDSETENKKDNGTDSKKDSEAENKKDNGTDSKKDSEAENKKDNGTDVKKDSEAENKKDNGTDVKKDSETENKKDNGTDSKKDSEAENKKDNGTDVKKDSEIEKKKDIGVKDNNEVENKDDNQTKNNKVENINNNENTDKQQVNNTTQNSNKESGALENNKYENIQPKKTTIITYNNGNVEVNGLPQTGLGELEQKENRFMLGSVFLGMIASLSIVIGKIFKK